MKKIFLLIALLNAFSASAIDKTADGTYLITSAQDLCDFSSLVNSGKRDLNAMLTADISMKGYDFTPIGTSSMGYSGTFDGQGFTIDSLTISLTSADGVGIFGYIDSAHILNLTAGPSNAWCRREQYWHPFCVTTTTTGTCADAAAFVATSKSDVHAPRCAPVSSAATTTS